MTQENVISDLEEKGALTVEAGTTFTQIGAEILRMHYRESLSDTENSKPKTFELIKVSGEGVSPKEYKFHGPKPAILRETPTVTPPRDFHKTAEWISTRFSQRFTGWTAHRVNQRRDGDDDIVTIEAINPDDQIVEKRIKMWMDGTNVQFKEVA